MPIIGLTDTKFYQPGRTFPRAFTLRKGIGEDIPGKQGKKLSDLDYFRVAFEPGYERLEPLFTEIYGERPQLISNVMLLGGTVEQVASAWLEQWATNKSGQPRLMTRCDGETVVKHLDTTTSHYSYEPTPCRANLPGGCKCGVKFRLSFLPLDLLNQVQPQEPFIGSIALRSPREVRDIMNYLRDRAQWRTQLGFEAAPLAGVVWDLYRAPVEIEIPLDPDGKNTPGMRTFWLVKIAVRDMGAGGRLLEAGNMGGAPQLNAPARQLPAATEPPPSFDEPTNGTGEVSQIVVNGIVVNYDKSKDGERRSKADHSAKFVYTLFPQDTRLPNIIVYSEEYLAPWLDLDVFRQQIGKRQSFSPVRLKFTEKSRKDNTVTGMISDVAPADMPE